MAKAALNPNENLKKKHNTESKKGIRIFIEGIVQGIGFRPFLYHLLNDLPDRPIGGIKNSGNLGVVVELFFPYLKLLKDGVNKSDRVLGDIADKIIALIRNKSPEMAFIERMRYEIISDIEFEKYRSYKSVKIEKSGNLSGPSITLPPDIAMCEDCLQEFNDPQNPRRYHYPFNSCVKCGPRFTIMKVLPYDRINSTMDEFPFCEDCLKEYNDPSDKRFHAQTFCCSRCGPIYFIYHPNKDVKKDPVGDEKNSISGDEIRGPQYEPDLARIVKVIQNKGIAAIKGIGGVNLVCLATSEHAINLLRERKRDRKYKPFAVMMPDIETAEKYCIIGEDERLALLSFRRPIVLCEKRAGGDYVLPDNIAPGLPNIGIILPYTGIHYLLFSLLDNKPIIFTSGNISSIPMAIKNRQIYDQMKDLADVIYVHNREIYARCDDSVIRFVQGSPTLIRRSRGYVPEYIRLPFIPKQKAIIAVGAELNSTGAVCLGDRIFPTQHIGNVKNLETYNFLKNAILHMKKMLKIHDDDIELICHDAHPAFQSTLLARNLPREINAKGKDYIDKNKNQSIHILPIYHHHAHLASLMVDHGMDLDKEIVALTLDGIGYGRDGGAWGGEILLGGYKSFKRVGYINPVLMIGGDLCAKYPGRMLLCQLLDYKIEQILKNDNNMAQSRLINIIADDPLFVKLKKRLLDLCAFPYGETEFNVVVKQFIENKYKLTGGSNGGNHQPLTSSFGRWLDSLAALFGVCMKRTYRGEPAMRLEGYIWSASRTQKNIFSNLKPENYISNNIVLGQKLLYDIANLLLTSDDNSNKNNKRYLAYRAVEIMAQSLAKIAKFFSEKYGKIPVGITGGVAYNEIIVGIIKKEIRRSNIPFLQHKKIPPGDAGISIGQIAVGAAQTLENIKGKMSDK